METLKLEKEINEADGFILHYKELLRKQLIDPQLAEKLIEVQEGVKERANIILNQY